MKKLALLGFGLCVALAFTSCKSSESAYKKAYEKAKQQELAEQRDVAPAQEVTPVATTTRTPSTTTQVPTGVRQERVSVAAGNGLKSYSVVCGSFGVKTNADNLKAYLDGQGYNSIIVYNAENGMYRVISETFADYNQAAQARDSFKAKYPNRKDFQGAWLLYAL